MELHGVNGISVGPEGLGQLLGGKTKDSIITALYRRPASLPPPIRIPGSKSGPLWLVEDVVAWMRARTMKEGESYKAGNDKAVKARAVMKARRGRPTQEEEIDAARRGITVPELRKLGRGSDS